MSARWLVLVYKIEREPSGPRVAAWRALKKIDGGYLRDGVFASRATDATERAIEAVARDVRSAGGEALVLQVASVDDEKLLALKLAGDEAPKPGPRTRAR